MHAGHNRQLPITVDYSAGIHVFPTTFALSQSVFPVKVLCLTVLDVVQPFLCMELKTNGKLKLLDSDAKTLPLLKQVYFVWFGWERGDW